MMGAWTRVVIEETEKWLIMGYIMQEKLQELDDNLYVRFERKKSRWQQGFKLEYLGEMVCTICWNEEAWQKNQSEGRWKSRGDVE